MGDVADLADRYIAAWAPLNPTGATFIGVPGQDDKLDDLSPEGFAAQAELARRTIAELDVIEPADEAEQVAKEAMLERLGLELARHDAGYTASEVSVISHGVAGLRMAFDLMPTEGEEAAANIAARLAAFPRAVQEYQRTLTEAAEAGQVSARAQLLAAADLCEAWADPERDDFFRGLAGRVGATGTLDAELRKGAEAASASVFGFAEFLRAEMAPRGRDKEAAGPERYALASQYFLGAKVDQEETYAWGFEELHRLETEMRTVAAEIAGPGATIAGSRR